MHIIDISHCVCQVCHLHHIFNKKLINKYKFTYITIMTRNCYNKYAISIKLSQMITIIQN